MFLFLIPAIWLVIAAFVVIICRGAASADAVMIAAGEHTGARPAGGAQSAARTHGHPRTSWRNAGRRPASRAAAGHARGSRVER
jgi:hypothetical protein